MSVTKRITYLTDRAVHRRDQRTPRASMQMSCWLIAVFLTGSTSVSAEGISIQATFDPAAVATPSNLVVPMYTPIGRKAHIQGVVDLDFKISTAGRVRNLEVRKRLPMGLTDACVKAVQHWQFDPSPVAIESTMRCEFKLLDYDYSETVFIEPEFVSPTHLRIFAWKPYLDVRYVMRVGQKKTKWWKRKQTMITCERESETVLSDMLESNVRLARMPDGRYQVMIDSEQQERTGSNR